MLAVGKVFSLSGPVRTPVCVLIAPRLQQELIAQARLLGQRKSAERAALSSRGGAAASAATGGPGGAVGSAAGGVGAGSGGAVASGVSPSSEYFPLQLNSSGMMVGGGR